MIDYHALNEIRRRASSYRPKKTQPDGDLFRQDVIILLQLLEQWRTALADFEKKVNA